MPTHLEYRFHHIHICSSDVPAAERWLVDGIGAELVGRHDSRGVPTSTLRLGGVQILIRGAREGEQLTRAGAPHFGTNHFGLEVADIDATVAELRARGVTIEVEPWDFGPAMRIAFVKGPDDVRIELLEMR
jgi:catechol 2,3-dioxygenase-like lactoylglutathione lyase family enzyme